MWLHHKYMRVVQLWGPSKRCRNIAACSAKMLIIQTFGMGSCSEKLCSIWASCSVVVQLNPVQLENDPKAEMEQFYCLARSGALWAGLFCTRDFFQIHSLTLVHPFKATSFFFISFIYFLRLYFRFAASCSSFDVYRRSSCFTCFISLHSLRSLRSCSAKASRFILLVVLLSFTQYQYSS